MEQATGFPGYDSLMGKDTATVAEVLRQQGWNTAWFGKNHNVPDWQTSQAGPFDLWPTGLGFEHFYGFVGAETNQWRPAAFDGTKPIEPYLGKPDYNFDYDIADRAIQWIRNQKAVAPDKPFFLYYAPGATHSPHQPSKEWIDQVQGPVRPGLGQDAGGDARPPEEAGHRPRQHPADAAAQGTSRRGTASRRSRSNSTPT